MKKIKSLDTYAAEMEEASRDGFPFKPDDIMGVSSKQYPPPKGLNSDAKEQHFLVWIIYQDWTERTQRITFSDEVNPAEAINMMVERLMNAPKVRQFNIAEMLFYGRKSFGVDYDPDIAFKNLGDILPNADVQN